MQKITIIKLAVFLWLLFFQKNSFAQSYIDYTLLSNQNYLNIQSKHIDSAINFTSVKPFITRNIDYDVTIKKKYLKRKIFTEDFVVLKDSLGNYIRINPVFNLIYAKDFNDFNRVNYTNTRGVYINGKLGKHVELNSWFTENQSFFPLYMDSTFRKTEVIAGQGRFKSFKKTGFDYANASGYISFFFNKITIQLGNGKTHIGDGYRSMILSTNAYNYPFLKLTIQHKNIFYQSQKALISAIDANRFIKNKGNSSEPLFDKTLFSYHLIAYTFKNKLASIALLDLNESAAAFNTNNKFNFNTVNVLPFIGSFIKNNKQNQLAALIKIVPFTNLNIYGQYKCNLFKNNEYAFQLGFKYFNVLKIKKLFLQLEYNFQNNTFKDIYHYNQAISHPVLHLRNELYFQVNYELEKGFGVIFQYQKIETINNFTNYFTSKLYYTVNSTNMLQVFTQLQLRESSNINFGNNLFLSMGVNCKLSDFSMDF